MKNDFYLFRNPNQGGIKGDVYRLKEINLESENTLFENVNSGEELVIGSSIYDAMFKKGYIIECDEKGNVENKKDRRIKLSNILDVLEVYRGYIDFICNDKGRVTLNYDTKTNSFKLIASVFIDDKIVEKKRIYFTGQDVGTVLEIESFIEESVEKLI